MIPWLLRSRSAATFPRIPLLIRTTRPLQPTHRLKHSNANLAKPASRTPIGSEAPSNALGSLVSQYRQSVTPGPNHIQEKLEITRRSRAKKALKHEGEELLGAQRKARIGLKLYETLSAQDLSILFKALNKFDVRPEIQAQEHDTIPAVQEMAKNDSQWKLETQTRHPDIGKGQSNAALGKRLAKVYKFESWTLATEHFWKRMNECFKQQDHHGELNVQYNPATKLTEVRIHINTHTPKALPKTDGDHAEPQQVQVGETKPDGAEASSDTTQPCDGAKRKITIGPPALTRKDFILAWSIDIAAFRARQKQALLDRRAAKRAASAEDDAQEKIAEQGLNVPADRNDESGQILSTSAQKTENQSKTASISPPTGNASSSTDKLFPQSPSATELTNANIKSDSTSEQPQQPPPSGPPTKRKARKPVGSDGLSLQHFLSRTQILAEYRKSVRATRTLPDSQTRRETLDWLRQDLEKLKGETDLHTIKEVLSRFRRDSKQFIPSMGLSTVSDGDQGGSRLIGRK